MNFLIDAFSFDWNQTRIDFLRIGLAFVLAVPIGWERSAETQAASFEA